ncbi:MAG: N-acetylneuraminate synthase [Terracidiphilus sp.]|nr:N-acetylneuraminate synthase [Terracidiphilus sp.]
MLSTVIIAEAGVNHNGSLDRALALVDLAANAGADAVKFQMFIPEAVISRYAQKAKYQVKTTGDSESQLEMVKRLALDLDAHKQLKRHCEMRNIQFLSTPFDLSSVDMLVNDLKVSRIKVGSGEITNAPLLLRVAQSGLPVIVSTGMSLLGEIEDALGVLAYGYLQTRELPSIAGFRQAFLSREGQQQLQEKVTLLHCTTEYPSPFEDVNLLAMDTMGSAFGLPVGLSDHTADYSVSIAAVARGACIIEKHFTQDRSLPGPDHKASLEPEELAAMVTAIRQVEQALGSPRKLVAASEAKNQEIARKSMVALQTIHKGEPFTSNNLGAKRPGTGISPIRYWEFLGKTATRDYNVDEFITL